MSDAPLRVLVVEDDDTGREVLDLRLQDWGYDVDTAGTLAQALRRLDAREPDIVVADVVLPDGKGLEILERLSDRNVRSPVIFITAHGSADLAVEAMKAGARDFLTKPLDYEKLRALVEAAGEEVALRAGIRELETELESDGGPGPLVGRSPEMREVFQMVELLAEKDASAIITGETGTGKELVARAIHDLSDRAEGPFIAVNAAAIPEGLIESELFGHEKGAFTGATRARQGSFELADGGTLLLDEIAEMPVELQPKLLRILEEERTRRVGGSREISFDARVLAATNRDPEEAVEDGDLRDDLFYRLNVFHVRVPALRDRPEDVPLLAQHFVRLFNGKHETSVEGLRPEALELLERYSWPGNVRELRNVVERAVVVAGSGLLEPSDLPPYLKEDGGDGASGSRVVLPVGDVTAAEAEKELILRTLEHVGGNKAEAARRLDLDPKTIRNKLKRWAREEGEGGADGSGGGEGSGGDGGSGGEGSSGGDAGEGGSAGEGGQ